MVNRFIIWCLFKKTFEPIKKYMPHNISFLSFFLAYGICPKKKELELLMELNVQILEGVEKFADCHMR